MENHPKKSMKKVGETPLRRSSRIHNQAKPTPSLVAAKKSAQMRLGHKKQPVFSFAQDIYQVARDSKDSVRSYTGIVYAEKLTEHKCLWDDNYPECPERVICILRRCEELGLLNRCLMIQPCSVTEAQLLTLHTSEHISLLRSTRNCNDVYYLESLSSQFDSIYFHPSTYDCSLMAAGSTIKLVDEICKKNIQNGMAIVRPPGHHAMQNEYCGYCYFNNVALAAKHALNIGIKKILIIDWDVHHGQATQQMFYDDNRVLYFSIHRYENGIFWPNLRESNFDYIGEGPGRGFNFNVPLNRVGMRDNDYMAIWHQLLLPVAYEFDPELIIVSAGYDAAIGCPEFQPEIVVVSAGFDSAMGDEKLMLAITSGGVKAVFAIKTELYARMKKGGKEVCVTPLTKDSAPTGKAVGLNLEEFSFDDMSIIKKNHTPYLDCGFTEGNEQGKRKE